MPQIPPEQVVRTWLANDPLLNGVRVVTELPSGLAGDVPLLQVTAIGGIDYAYRIDDARVDVTAWAGTREAARVLAEQVKTSLRLRAQGSTVTTPEGRAYVAHVETTSLPKWVPYDDTDVRRFEATYRVVINSVP